MKGLYNEDNESRTISSKDTGESPSSLKRGEREPLSSSSSVGIALPLPLSVASFPLSVVSTSEGVVGALDVVSCV